MKEKWWSSWLLKSYSLDQVAQRLAKSSGFRSFLENANNSAQSLFLRLWSCCAIREMKRWQWEEQRSAGIRFIRGGWLQCPRFQRGITGREVGVGGVTLKEDQTRILSVWKSDLRGLGLFFFLFSKISFHIVSSLWAEINSSWRFSQIMINIIDALMNHLFNLATSLLCVNSLHGSWLPTDSDLMWKLLRLYQRGCGFI